MQGAENIPSDDEDDTGTGIALASFTQSDLDSEIEKGFPTIDAQDRAFSEEYLENGFKHREAAVKIGRSASAGIKLVNKPIIKAYIRYLQDQNANETIFTKQFYEAKHLELFDMAMGEVPVACVDKDGMEYQAKVFNGPLAHNILKESAVMQGVSKPEEGKSKGVTVVVDVGALLGTKTDNADVAIDADFVKVVDDE